MALRSDPMKNRGFTLLELVTTLAIVSILIFLAVSSFIDQTPRRQLKEAASTLIGQFQLVRQKAITDGKQYKIVFDPDTKKYSYQTVGGKQMALGEQTLPQHVMFGPLNKDAREVIFYQNGTIENGTLSLKNSKEESIKITTNITGRITQAWSDEKNADEAS